MAKSSKTDFFRQIVKKLADPDTHIADDATSAAEFGGTIDTGSYILNAALCGSVFGGVPNNKITGFAGDSATGKTFFVLGLVRRFLLDNPTGAVFYYDSEAAVTKQMMVSRGIDTSRVIIVEPETIQSFRTHAKKVLDNYAETPKEDRPPMMMVLDSLGQLSTIKEIADTTEGKDTRDMTKAPATKGAFRVLTLRCARLNVPMLITNHTYAVIGAYVPTKEMSSGSGLYYAASQILFLSKKKDRDADKDVVGSLITCKMKKSRFTREEKAVTVRLSHDTGLDRYYGLLDFFEEEGYIKKDGQRYNWPDGTKPFRKNIEDEPAKYFTKAFLEKADKEIVGPTFKYGEGEEPDLIASPIEEDEANGG